MKNSLLLVTSLLLCLFTTTSATNYYISSTDGNDSNDGKTATSAWKSIDKVNSSNSLFVAGDSIFFKKGDIFYGSMTIGSRSGTDAKPIVYTTYGTGNMPILRGSQKVTNWTVHNGNIWKANLPKLSRIVWNGTANVPFYYRTPSLFINNERQRLGREPDYNPTNGGFRTINTHAADNKTITEGAALPYPTNHFQGADIAIRTNHDLFNIETVVSHSGSSVVVTATNASSSLNTIRDKYGYIFQNHINTLNLDGEWFHDIATEILYLYSETDPNTRNIEVPFYPSTLTINSSNYVKVMGLRIENAANNTLGGQNDTYLTIDGCHINNSSDYGTNTWNITNASFINNSITNVNDVGVRWEGGNGIVFSGNTFKNIGMWAGMGGEDYIAYTGLRLIVNSAGNPSIIEKNTLDSIGYHGINFGGKYLIIRQNDVGRFCSIKDDGGGIYSANNIHPNKIYENFVHDAPGATQGTPVGEGVKTAGIYPDNDSQNWEIYKNTIYNIGKWGILANLSSNNSFYENTIFNTGAGIVLNTYQNNFGPNGTLAAGINNNMKRNILFPRSATQLCAQFNNSVNPSDLITKLGTLDSNYYCQPYAGGKEIEVNGSSTNSLTFGAFRSAYSAYEANGKAAPLKLNASDDPNTSIRLETNPSTVAKTVDLGITQYVDAKARNYTGVVTLLPYTSLALIKGFMTDVKDAPTLSGIRYKIYPNLIINNTLSLEIELNQPKNFVVRAYSLLGTLVYEKNKGQMNSGVHALQLNDFNIPISGIYFLQLSFDKTSATERIMVVK